MQRHYWVSDVVRRTMSAVAAYHATKHGAHHIDPPFFNTLSSAIGSVQVKRILASYDVPASWLRLLCAAELLIVQ